MTPYTTIDMNTYKRRPHFDYFRSLQYPYVGVTVDVDVTALTTFCKEKGYSFYLTFLHAAANAANEVPELRQRIRDGGIIEYKQCPTSHVELLDDGTYCYCTLEHHMELADYIPYAEATRKKYREIGSIQESANSDSMFFITSLPWLHYSALIQPVAGGNESNPRISWGKYEKDFQGRKQMPVTLLAHHSLVDGLQIAAFYENLKKQITYWAEENPHD